MARQPSVPISRLLNPLVNPTDPVFTMSPMSRFMQYRFVARVDSGSFPLIIPPTVLPPSEYYAETNGRQGLYSPEGPTIFSRLESHVTSGLVSGNTGDQSQAPRSSLRYSVRFGANCPQLPLRDPHDFHSSAHPQLLMVLPRFHDVIPNQGSEIDDIEYSSDLDDFSTIYSDDGHASWSDEDEDTSAGGLQYPWSEDYHQALEQRSRAEYESINDIPPLVLPPPMMNLHIKPSGKIIIEVDSYDISDTFMVAYHEAGLFFEEDLEQCKIAIANGFLNTQAGFGLHESEILRGAVQNLLNHGFFERANALAYLCRTMHKLTGFVDKVIAF